MLYIEKPEPEPKQNKMYIIMNPSNNFYIFGMYLKGLFYVLGLIKNVLDKSHQHALYSKYEIIIDCVALQEPFD